MVTSPPWDGKSCLSCAEHHQIVGTSLSTWIAVYLEGPEMPCSALTRIIGESVSSRNWVSRQNEESG